MCDVTLPRDVRGQVASVVAPIQAPIEMPMAPAVRMLGVVSQDTQFLHGLTAPSPAPPPTRWGDPHPDDFLA